MNPVEMPAGIQEWVKTHPILAAISAIALLGAIVVFAVRYGDMTHRW